LSAAAAGLLRALIARSGASREQILVSAVKSTDWHSLTFTGERHRIALHVVGQHAVAHGARMVHRVGEAEFSIPGILVADITVEDGPTDLSDGSVGVTIEALTLVDA
jgi:hypothetical protein